MSDDLLLGLLWLAIGLIGLLLVSTAVVFVYVLLDYPVWQGRGQRLRRVPPSSRRGGQSKPSALGNPGNPGKDPGDPGKDPWQASADRLVVPLPREDEGFWEHDDWAGDLTSDLEDDLADDLTDDRTDDLTDDMMDDDDDDDE